MPLNALFLTRNEQVSGSSPLVGSLCTGTKTSTQKNIDLPPSLQEANSSTTTSASMHKLQTPGRAHVPRRAICERRRVVRISQDLERGGAARTAPLKT